MRTTMLLAKRFIVVTISGGPATCLPPRGGWPVVSCSTRAFRRRARRRQLRGGPSKTSDVSSARTVAKDSSCRTLLKCFRLTGE